MKYVYILRAGESHYKVGVATSVKKRLSGLQTSNPVKVDIVSAKLLDDAYAVEGQLHARLKEWNVSGEWFSLQPMQVIDLLIELNRLPEPDIAMGVRLRDILANQDEAQRRIEKKLNKVVELANRNTAAYWEQVEERKNRPEPDRESKRSDQLDEEIMQEALEVARVSGKISTSLLQRKLRLGYGRAARIVELMEEKGLITKLDGIKPRELIT